MTQFMAIASVGLPIALGTFCAAAASDEKQLPFKITTKRNTDSVEVRAHKEKTVFSVKSPYGISQATIERRDEKWPDSIVLHLHLKGLENFQATNGLVTLAAAVGVRDKKLEARIWKDGKEDSPLSPKSPYWIETRVVGRDGQPANEIPFNEGYFELRLPKAFFESNPKSITVNWIDFYRN